MHDDIGSHKGAGFAGLTSCLFKPSELRAVLSVYTAGVMSKGWRDYGISSTQNQTVFAVIDKTVSGQDFAAAIEKRRAHKGKKFFYRVIERSKQIISTDDFKTALAHFDQIGRDGGDNNDSKSSKGNRHLKLVK